MFEDTKGIMRHPKQRRDNSIVKKDKQRSTQYTTQKTKDRATRTPLKNRE